MLPLLFEQFLFQLHNTGKGRVNGNGIEVDSGNRLGSGGRQKFRQPKNQQFTTVAPVAPLVSYGPSTPEYYSDNSNPGYNDYDDGYNYPVPSNPLPLPVPTTTTQAPPSYNPSTSGKLCNAHWYNFVSQKDAHWI